jgi:hypothetical protein
MSKNQNDQKFYLQKWIGGICAAVLIAGCSGSVTGGGDPSNNPDQPATGDTIFLSSLVISYSGEPENLINFTPEKTDYTVGATKAGNFEVSAGTDVAAYPDASVSINEESAASSLSKIIPVPTLENSVVVISLSWVKEDSTILTNEYRITITPPQATDGAVTTLSGLKIVYEGDLSEANVFLPAFSSGTGDYTIDCENGRQKIKVTTMSTTADGATAVIKYGDDKDSAVQVALNSSIDLPVIGSKYIWITVTSSDTSSHQDYIVQVNPYVATTRTWRGTVTASGLAANMEVISVIARDASVYNMRTVATSGADNSWTFDADIAFTPISFVVGLQQTTGSTTQAFRSTAIEPENPQSGVTIPLSISNSDVGISVASAAELANFNISNNYTLAADIDLSTGWVGPTGYKGTFNGNGYKIDLMLTKENGNTGLFQSLGDDATIKNLVVNVIPKTGGLRMTANSHFGGVVGDSSAARIVLNNITVKGALEYNAPASGLYLLAGGLIGEITGGSVTISNCVSEIDINANYGTTANNNEYFYLVAGGIIGKLHGGTVIIKNSYSTGNIVLTTNAALNATAGSIAGAAGMLGGSSTGNWTIENCYASGGVTLNRTSGSRIISGGGLVGYHPNGTITIRNCAALNTAVLVSSVGSPSSGRIIGNNATMANNVSLSAMQVGTAGTTIAAGDSGNTLTGKHGLGKAENEITSSLFSAILGWDSEIWDFSDVSSTKYPVLRK